MQASYPRGAAVRILHPRPPMRALTVRPGTPNSGALATLAEPEPRPGEVLVQAAKADPAWLRRLITRRVPLDEWGAAFEKRPDDIKNVIEPAR